MQQAEQAVQNAVVLQNTHPSIGAHEHVDPSRQRDDENQRGALDTCAGDGIGGRITEQQTDKRGQNRNAHGAEKHLHEYGVAEKACEIVQRELSLKEGCAFNRECIRDDEQHRNHDKNGNPKDIGICHGTETFHVLSLPFS